jgi:hypothetical protein
MRHKPGVARTALGTYRSAPADGEPRNVQRGATDFRPAQAGLAEYDEMEAIAWNWQSIDGAMHKAPLATECVGPNPTDRGKKWAQTKPVGRRD